MLQQTKADEQYNATLLISCLQVALSSVCTENWRLLLVASRLPVAMLGLDQVSWCLADYAWAHT
jgi:hypothetical protein